ncbi:hypothetical protein [Kribbella sp. NPDC048915]|uniref:hypothetical protein n=1 Tax=Kribbella sp. NPDC048915 TaxID=3155148 RepID=UPI003411D361
MRKIALAAASLAIAGAGAAFAPSANAATTDASATMGTTASCPSGAVCIQELNGTIYSKNIFYSYGAHNLSNVIGDKIVINNQTGGAGYKLCSKYGGSGTCTTVVRWTGPSKPYNMTWVNSVVLVK